MIRLTAPSALHAANPKLLQRIYDVLGVIFRDLGREILAVGDEKSLEGVWEVVRRGLGAPARPEEEEDVEEEKMEVEAAVEKAAESDADDSDEEGEEEVAPIASTSAQPIEPTTPLHSSLPRNFRTTPQTRRLLANSFAFLVRKAKPSSSDAESQEHVSLEELVKRMIEDVADVEDLDGGERANGGKSAKGRYKGKGKGRGQEEGSSNVFAEGLTWLSLESCAVRSFLLPSSPP
jgi:U3 small nucleolar RNA-associated protein 20